MRPGQIVAVLLLVTSLGCSSLKSWKANGFKVGPSYRKPCTPTAERWLESDDESVVSQCEPVIDWWLVFGDPLLEHLVQTAYQQNLNLRTLGLRVLESRSQFEISALNLFPQSQTASGRYGRNAISTTTANVFPGVERYFGDWRTGFDMSWELDLWGRIRRAVEASEATLDAEIENYDDALVTLIGDVAASYIELRSFDERLKLAERNAEIQNGSLQIATARENEGRVSELDVEQAKSNLADTRALIPALRQGRRLALNRLALLLGMTPYALEPLLRERGELPEVPPEVAVTMPAQLLRRRPDIRSAERQVAAQCARIGVATAELYPQFALTGQIGFNSASFDDLFSSASGTGLIAPGFSWKILNYGRLLRNIEVADLQFQQAVVQYQDSVLAAHREVEDALIQFVESRNRAAELKKSAAAAAKSVELVNTQYTEGDVDFGRVFVLQSALVQRQDQLVSSEADAAIALVRCYKAMGGGWQLRLGTTYTGCGPTMPIPCLDMNDAPSVDEMHGGTSDKLPATSDESNPELIPPVFDPYESVRKDPELSDSEDTLGLGSSSE